MEQPLVSIYSLTYKSSKTILETLESIYNLTYPNIELVISDDASPDDTVEVCRKWIDNHKTRFKNVQLLTVEKNTGVAKNQKRAVAACKGEWIKNIAGDDALFPDCIEKLLAFTRENPEARMVLSKCARYDTFLDEEHFIEIHGSKEDIFNKVSTAAQQYEILLCWPCVDAPAMFYHRSVFDIPEFQNCGYKGLEDYPWFLTYTRLGNRIYFCDEVVSKYRKSATSLQNTGNHNNLITKSYLAHFFEETHNYYHGLDKIARYGVNIYDWIQCYTKSLFLRKLLKYMLYPAYWVFFKIKLHYDYNRINNALKQEVCNV